MNRFYCTKHEMFLRRINRLLSNDNINKIFHRHAGSVNLLEKWKNKFEEEKVPEIQSSLKIILAHVLNVKKVCVLQEILIFQIISIF